MNSIKNFIKNYWVWIALAVILIVISIVMYRSRQARLKKEQEELLKGGNGTGSSTPDAKYPLTPYALAGEYSKEKGSMGSQIKTLQMIYNANNKSGSPLDVDGKYGPKTLGAFLGFYYDMIATNGQITKAQYEQIVKKFNNE